MEWMTAVLEQLPQQQPREQQLQQQQVAASSSVTNSLGAASAHKESVLVEANSRA